ncbi:MAG: heme ABC exporter ATP-binding protein CcmA [Alphaproteobacteria bacterium]
MLTCNNITISYNEKKIFQNFGLTIYPNSLLLIRGANGSGKTSLLKVLAGLTMPADGEILCESVNIKYNFLLYKDLINYIGHSNAVKNRLTVIENIEFWANLYGHTELILAAINYFQLQDFLDAECEKLSAGYKQRVALCRLIIRPCKIWLLDEPETNLDQNGKKLLLNLISSRVEQGGIVIINTHNNIELSNILEVNLDDYKINY